MSHDDHDDEKPTWPAGESVETYLLEIRKSAALFKDLMGLCGADNDDVLMNMDHESWWRLADVAEETQIVSVRLRSICLAGC